MVNEKSKANLRRGNPRNKGNKNGRGANGSTWADLISAYGETKSDIDPRKTWKQIVVESAFKQAALGNASILRELMQRSEPQDIGVKLNFPALTDEQVNRIADGEDPRTVLASPGAGGA